MIRTDEDGLTRNYKPVKLFDVDELPGYVQDCIRSGGWLSGDVSSYVVGLPSTDDDMPYPLDTWLLANDCQLNELIILKG